jgi:hypothetical protein
MCPCKTISHIEEVAVTNNFSNPTHKTKTATEVGGRLLVIATHLDQSNYVPNQKQGVANKYVLTLFLRLFQGSSKAMKAWLVFEVPAIVQWIHWIGLMDLIQDFQCRVTY